MGIAIKRVAVLGAGVMGQGIAAHLANAGIPSYLFDITPSELTPQEQEKGLTLDDHQVRNRFALAGLASIAKSKPPLLYKKDLTSYITACNYEDHIEKLGECDWIVEVVVERLDIKRRVFEMVEENRRPGSVVSSNTSGLSVADMAEGCSEDFRRHGIGRYLFERLIAYARSKGISGIRTEVLATNKAMLALHRALGHRLKWDREANVYRVRYELDGEPEPQETEAPAAS